jgi:hypothetical protein
MSWGGENENQKVAMYLVRRCCDRTLPEIAEYPGTNGYATVSWNCRVVESKMAKEMKFKDRSEQSSSAVNSAALYSDRFYPRSPLRRRFRTWLRPGGGNKTHTLGRVTMTHIIFCPSLTPVAGKPSVRQPTSSWPRDSYNPESKPLEPVQKGGNGSQSAEKQRR